MGATIFFSPSPSNFFISSSLKSPKPNSHHHHHHHHHHHQSSTKTTPMSLSKTEQQQQKQQHNVVEPIKAPTAPWMRGQLFVKPHQVLDLSQPKSKKVNLNKEMKAKEKIDKALFGKESGVRGKKAMKKIIKSVERIRLKRKDFGAAHVKKCDKAEVLGRIGGGDVAEERIGGKRRVFGDAHVKKCDNVEVFKRFGFLGRISGDDVAEEEERIGGKRMPWTQEVRVVIGRVRKEKVVTAAQSKLDKGLLERLRGEAKGIRNWVKVKKAGVVERVVDEIKFHWRTNELAMVKFDLPLCRNMDRAREIVEMKTGGLVVWSYKDTLVVYRGSVNKPSTVKRFPAKQTWYADGQETHSSETSSFKVNKNISQTKSTVRVVDKTSDEEDENWKDQPVNGSLFERETDRLLDGLGPRFTDWWMSKPLPVDADLLPGRVPGYRTPFRRCPPNTRSQLKDAELTQLREVAQGLPTHFVLGRNRNLQGLAAAIIRLWEKSPIAKISLKWGALNTNNEQMANELKSLTGGILILRNKFYIILFRGKDFLPCQLADLVTQREIELRNYQLNEENARRQAIEISDLTGPQTNTSTSGTLSEFENFRAGFGYVEQEKSEFELQLEAEKEKLNRELTKQEHKLHILNRKIERSVRELSKLKSKSALLEEDFDQEMFTEEERESLRKLGQKMGSVLVLGRRGVFQGVLEGLHQHWKFREVVKVITMQRVISRVIYTAKLLEAQSGGILVSIENLKEGHAIILYRGKNYKRPSSLPNLITKREALHRSIELQRIGSLKFIAYQRRRAISELKLKLAQLQESREENIKTKIVQN
ncbi:hypothetical protein ACFE04_010162 [Oxalis oulophora]